MDVLELLKAVQFGIIAHGKQQRKTGGPYITHPIDAAMILLQEGVTDMATLQAAILHDVVEDTKTTLDEIREAFGDKVASIVFEVTDDKTLKASQRKQLQISHMPHMTYEAKLVKYADKISNVGGLVKAVPPSWSALRVQGYAVWCREAMKTVHGTHQGLERRLANVLKQSVCLGGNQIPLIPDNLDIDEFLENYYNMVDSK